MNKFMGQSLFVGGAVVMGFAVGYGIGKKAREATPSNVKTDYVDGVVTIKADVGAALSQGVDDWFDSVVEQIG